MTFSENLCFSSFSNFLSLFLQIDHHGIPNIGNTGAGGAGGSSTNNSGMHTSMTSSLHRRSLQDVDALGLFHHGRGLGRHLSRQSSDDSRHGLLYIWTELLSVFFS